MCRIYSEKRWEKADPLEESNGKQCIIWKAKKLFIEFFFFPRFIFQSRVRNFSLSLVWLRERIILRIIKERQRSFCKTQERKNTEEFNKYFPLRTKKKNMEWSKKKTTVLALYLRIHIIEFLIVSRHSLGSVANLFWLQIREKKKCQITKNVDDKELWHETNGFLLFVVV